MHAMSSLARHKSHSVMLLVLKACLVVLLAVEYPEDGKEQVDDVQVKRDSRSNLLLNMIVAHNELGVHQNISTENERCHRSVDKLRSAVVGKEGCHKPKKDEYPQTSEQVGHPIRKVILCLAGKQGQSNKDASRQHESQKDNLRVVEGHNNGYRVGLQDGKTA